jgi:hypothetical protein
VDQVEEDLVEVVQLQLVQQVQLTLDQVAEELLVDQVDLLDKLQELEDQE